MYNNKIIYKYLLPRPDLFVQFEKFNLLKRPNHYTLKTIKFSQLPFNSNCTCHINSKKRRVK